MLSLAEAAKRLAETDTRPPELRHLDRYREAVDDALRAAIGRDLDAIQRDEPEFFGAPASDVDSFLRIPFNSRTPVAEIVADIKNALKPEQLEPTGTSGQTVADVRKAEGDRYDRVLQEIDAMVQEQRTNQFGQAVAFEGGWVEVSPLMKRDLGAFAERRGLVETEYAFDKRRPGHVPAPAHLGGQQELKKLYARLTPFGEAYVREADRVNPAPAPEPGPPTKAATDLQPGDQILYRDTPVTILEPARESTDQFGRTELRFKARREDTGKEGDVLFGPTGQAVLDTSRVKRDDDAMTTTAAPNSTEPTIGVTTSSRGRTTTVTLPDGTTATRTSKTRSYTHAVVATRDLHQRAQQIQADTDRRQAFVDALQAWVDRGANTDELKAYPSRSLSYNERQAGKSANEYYLPGFEPVRQSVRGGRDYWEDSMGFSLPNFKDTERTTHYDSARKADGPELTAWERYGPSHVLDRQRAHIASNEKRAAELSAGPRYAYEVIRWSGSRDNAQKAASSEFSNPWTTYRVIGVGDDLTGQTADESKPVKVKPTKAELDAAKAARAEQDKVDRAKRNEEWTARKVADIRRHVVENNEAAARIEVTATNEQGLRAIARAFGIKSTPRGMGDRQKTEWLRNAILEAAKKS